MILDCTFRDGGYYVDWDFDKILVNKYLDAVKTAKIDIIEMGFRFLTKEKFLGAFAYTSDDHLKSLIIPDTLIIAVMVNADELINYKAGLKNAVNLLFGKKINSPVDMVRIAAHVKDISSCQELVKLLSQLGYRVCLNIMQVDSLKPEEITDIAKKISTWSQLEALYFADSFGNMDPDNVKNTVKAIQDGWTGNIGFHAHDNKGQALANCMSALKSGVSYIDGTLSGMGRGAGNVKTENLLIELSTRGYGDYFADAVFPIVIKDFQKLQDYHKWGPNIYYHLSATYGIHPTFIQEMLSDERYETEHILSTINFLKSRKSKSYSSENLLLASKGIEGNEHGSWSVDNYFKERSVLIFGSGPSTKKYIENITQFIKKRRPLVLCLNANKFVPSRLIDFYVACHDVRILIESSSYNNLDKPLIIPLSRLPDEINNSLRNINVHDYGLRLQDESFDFSNNGCVLSKPIALAYAIAIASAGGASEILFAGIDGYENSDPRQQEIIELLNRYKNLKDAIPLTSITPSTFPIKKTSIFDPLL